MVKAKQVFAQVKDRAALTCTHVCMHDHSCVHKDIDTSDNRVRLHPQTRAGASLGHNSAVLTYVPTLPKATYRQPNQPP